MPKTRSRFQGFVTRYFESNGCTVEADGDLLVITASPIIQSGREAVPVAGAEQNMGQSCRIGVLTRDAERPPTELDYVIVDDSPVSHVRAGTRIERRDNFVFFGRDILLPGWREYAEQQLTQIEQDSRVRGDNTALPELIELRVARGESSGPYPESPENRALVCGNPEDEVERILLERRRNDVQLLSKMKGTEVGTPFSIPLKLDALTVRDQDLLTAVRAGLLNVTKRELGDDIYLELLRWGYVRLYIDRIGDWNIGGNLDPNQGTIADLLRHLGPRGEFVLGCDKHYAVHFTATDIARKDDLSDGAYPAHFFRTLGERFAEDVSLRLEMVSCDADEPGQRQLDYIKTLYRQAHGLLGPSDLEGLVGDLAAMIYQLDRPGFLPEPVVTQVISNRLPSERRLTANMDLVSRVLQESGVFRYDASLGFRFSHPRLEEDLFVEQLLQALEELAEYGDDRALLRVSELLIAPQLTDRAIFKCLQQYGKGRGGVEGCRPLVQRHLARALNRDYSGIRDERQLRQFRCAVLRVAVVFAAWLDSDDWLEPLRDSSLDLSRIDAHQLYVARLDLTSADLSNATIPFVCFDDCKLDHANLSNAYLPSGKVVGGSQQGANLTLADLATGILQGGCYTGASFQGTSLWATDLSAANEIEEEGLKGAEAKLTKLPQGLASVRMVDVADPGMIDACLRTLNLQAEDQASESVMFRSGYYRHPKVQIELNGNCLATLKGTTIATNVSGYNCRLTSGRSYEDGQPTGVAMAYADGDGQVFAHWITRKGDNESLGEPQLVSPSEPKLEAMPSCLVSLAGDLKTVAVEQPNGRVAFILNKNLSLLDDRALPDNEVRITKPYEDQPSCLLSLFGSHFVVGYRQGDVALYEADPTGGTSSERPSITPIHTERGAVEPVAMDFLPDQRQVIVARADSSVDVYHLQADRRLTLLTTFQLAHERIHSIITYPGQARYLIAGIAAGRSDGATLFAMCNARLEVLAVWPFLDGAQAYKAKKLKSILEQLVQQESTESDEQTLGIVTLRPAKLQRFIGLIEREGSLVEEKVSEGKLKLRLNVPEPFEGRPLGDYREVQVGDKRYYLRISLTLSRHAGGTEDGEVPVDRGGEVQFSRPVPQESVLLEKDGDDLLLTFEHPILRKQGTLALPHTVECEVAYELGEKAFYKTEKPLIWRFHPKRLNPFSGHTLPVKGDQFFAYNQEVEDLVQKLMYSSPFVVQGARRSGKSSFLEEAERLLQNNQNVVTVQFNVQAEHRDFGRLVEAIVRGLPKALEDVQRRGFDVEKVLARGTDEQTLLLEAARELEELGIQQPVVVVMLDEWGHLFESGEEKANSVAFSIDKEVWAELTSLLKKLRNAIDSLRSNYRFVFAGLPWHFTATEESSATSSRLWTYVQEYLRMERATDCEIERMIRTKLKVAKLEITDEALEYCLKLATGVLHDANRIMYCACEKLGKDALVERRHMDAADVETELIQHYEGYRGDLWRQLSEETRRWLFDEASRERPIWEVEEIKRTAENSGVDLTPLFQMGYSSGRGGTLFVPHGLTLAIRANSQVSRRGRARKSTSSGGATRKKKQVKTGDSA